MQFVGQTHLLRVPLETPTPGRDELRCLFEQVYYNRFRVELSEIRANLVNINTSVIGARPEIDLRALIDAAGRRATLAEARTGRRPVYFEGGWRETPVFWRDLLPTELHLDGPAVIEQMDATTVIEPGDRATGDADGNIIIQIGGATS
jgi:N-methylhydantoinase A